ncbi:MAG TPA: catalase family peroxidase [Parvibaculum sp.]|jgi:catalase
MNCLKRSLLGGGAALALGALTMGLPAAARAEDGAGLVNDLHSAFGDHHARAVHAKGIILEGTFVPTKAAHGLSAAEVFAEPASKLTVRFSDFTGIPDIPDNIDEANPRGFAVKFQNEKGAPLDIVSHNFNGFPTATSDEFGELLRAIGSSGPTAAKPTALDKFLGSHPIAKTFLTTQNPPPVSYATTTYFGVNSFAFVDAKGKKTYVRYRFVPKAGEHYVDAAAKKTLGANYLQTEIGKRVAAGPIAFDWYAQISQPGDKIEDPSIAWPESRKLVKLGTLKIDRLAADQASADKALLFLPGSPPSGIEAADPMLKIRNEAYPVSFSGRQ